MLKLKKRGLVTVELPGGVTIKATPFGASDIDLATHAVRRRLGAAADAAAGLARYGIAAGDIEEAGEGVSMALYGVPESLLAIELGIRHIDSWMGVGTDADEDTPAPIEPGFVALLFNEWLPDGAPVGGAQNYGRAWLRRMLAHSTLEPGAPKGSAVSPGTSTGEAATTAANAVKSETPAQTGGA